MEHAIHRGDYIQLNWTLNSIAGQAFSLQGLTTRLYYSNGINRSLATGTTVGTPETETDNVLTWMFMADNQWKTGDYDLLLEVYQNGTKLVAISYPAAFTLLSGPAPENSQSTASQDPDATINVVSSCDFYRFAPVAPTVGDDGFWYINGVKTEYPSTYTLVYDETTKNFLVFEGDPDAPGATPVQTITALPNALAEFNEAYEAAEGTSSSEAGDGSRWGAYKTTEGTSSATAGDNCRWGAYKSAEASRNIAAGSAEGTSSSTAGDGSRWGAYKTAEAARDTESASAEGTSSSTAGDGTRWGAYKTAEGGRNDTFTNSQNQRTNAYNSAEGSSSSVAGSSSRWGQYKEQEGDGENSTANDGSRWGAYKDAEADRDSARLIAEGTKTGSAAGDGTRWGSYMTSEGTNSSTAGDGSRWGAYKTAEAARGTAASTVEGTSSSTAGDGTRWGAYKTAEANRNTSAETAEGSSSSTAGDGSRWGAYKSAEASRETAYEGQEGTSESEAGDGTRWGAYKTAEAARSELVNSKADKDTDAVEGNIAKFDSSGNPVDSGIAADYINQLGQKVNELNQALTIDNSVYELTTHSFYTASTYKRSDYIPVFSGQRITYRLFGSTTAGLVVFFDTNKQFVSAIAGTYSATAAVREGVFECPNNGYIVVGCFKQNISDAYIQLSPNISDAIEFSTKNRNALFDISPIQSWAFGVLTNAEQASGVTTRIVTTNIIFANNDVRITVDEGYNWYLYFYNSSGSRISTSDNWQSQEYIIQKGTYFRVNMRKSDDSTLLITDCSHLHLQELTGIVGEIYKSIKEEQIIDWRENLVYGTIDPSTWTDSHYHNSSRVSVNPDYPIHLTKGSVISIPFGYKIYPSWRVDNVITPAAGWLVTSFVCPVDGEYCFVYMKDPETDFTEATIQEVVSGITIIDAGDVATNNFVIQERQQCLNACGNQENIISIARCGYDPQNLNTPPEQSLASYKEAYKKGYRYMLADVRFTSNNVPVAVHDETINAVAKNSDGTAISSSIYVSSSTLEELDTYDFGIIKGSAYAGGKVMRIEDFLRWCKIRNCIPVLEVKDALTEDGENFAALAAMVKKYGLSEKVFFEADAGQATAVVLHNAFPKATIGKTCVSTTDFAGGFLTESLAIKGDNKVVWYIWLGNGDPTGIISNTMIEKALENGIQIAASEVMSYDAFKKFIGDENNLVCDYVAIRPGTFDDFVNQLNP